MIKTEALLGKLFEDSKSILLITDESFNIRYITSSVEFVFGVNPYSVLGRNAFDFVSEANREAWKKCLLDSNGNKSSEIKLSNSKGEPLYFDLTVRNHVANDEIRGLVVIMYDITARKLKHKNLEKTNDHLDHFIFKTIHDLRAPIHSALGLVDLTRQSSNEEKDKYISLIQTNLKKIESFIDDVSDFYKNEKLAIQNEKVNFNLLFAEEREILKNLPGAREITISYKFEGNCQFHSDSIRIRSILSNIISNSIKYKDPFKANPFIKVGVAVDEACCYLTVQDNGVGIDEQYQEKIFDIFFRVDSKLPGTGLGLYIVNDTVNRLGGSIEVTSKLGVGTTFLITLPNLMVSAVNVN